MSKNEENLPGCWLENEMLMIKRRIFSAANIAKGEREIGGRDPSDDDIKRGNFLHC